MTNFPIRLCCTCDATRTPGSVATYREQVIVEGLHGTTRPVCLDRCIAPEVLWLNFRHKVRTLGSCCGHGKRPGSILVGKGWVPVMQGLGYERLGECEGGVEFRSRSLIVDVDVG